jgi:acyl-CoA reductase-like NAD-dependent aldehyde dehydrogenase
VLDDADPVAVAEGVRLAGLMNSGQACVAQTRVLVPVARSAERQREKSSPSSIVAPHHIAQVPAGRVQLDNPA